MPLPDLIATQKSSYAWFLDQGIKDLFEEASPITDFTGRDLELYLEDYSIDEPKFDEVTSREKNISFDAPLRVKTRLLNRRTGQEHAQEIYLGDVPVMTDRGTFIINGIERVIISQLIRSPGAYFTANNLRGRNYYGAKIIPNRGAWIEIETDTNNVLWIKVDRKRKVAATSLLRAFGSQTNEELIELFKDVDTHPNISFIENTLAKDAATTEDEGLIEVYKRIRPGDLATADNAKGLIHAMFFNFDRYDLGRVGMYKFDAKFALGLEEDEFDKKEQRVLSPEKLVLVLKEIIRLNVSQELPDDIDHLGNRRIRAIGELVQDRFRIGIARMERIIKDRMSTYELEGLLPNKLINARPVIGAIREFFMSSQLSQFMDQINPLAELEHKRRVSALGPGGLSRDRAGFEVRDVHTTHYGRICPIATPEGPNIGLVGHLASYAKINSFGFLETPYRRVINKVANDASLTEGEISRETIKDVVKEGEKITTEIAKKLAAKKDIKDIKVKARLTNTILYLNAIEEERYTTASATLDTDENGYFLDKRVPARVHGEASTVDVDNIEFLDVASNQLLSIATSMIPFLEHDDATRALMGTNMQRQSVPCITPDAPLVGTGIERAAAENSGHVLFADEDGVITAIDGDRIELTAKGKVYNYRLNKFLRSNASSSINQRSVVDVGDKVKKGDRLCDGPSIKDGELALGQNVLVAYMAWDGYNYEDAIIISERLVQRDRYTSVHIDDYANDVRETKLGPELVTSDIPNVSEEKLKNLDAEGIIRIGAEAQSGDILVGKITPKGETELTPEERLLRAIFGEKARDVRDSSLYLEHGEHGKITDVRVFSADEGDKLQPGVIKQVQVTVADMRKIQVGDKMAGRHGNKGVISRVVPVEDMPFLEDGTPVDIILSPLGVISRMNLGQLLETHLGLAANALGYTAATLPLNGIDEKTIQDELERAGFPRDGQLQLFDGRTGEAFDHKTTVGYSYMLKLNHMVEDKIHQRSIGPYSLITQQPLGGKAQFGGQRFGEMEVWALQAYGAAHTLQEILTIKSDDVPGRSKAYEAIIKNEPITRVNLPESFNVLVREMKGLCLDMQPLKRDASGELHPAEEVLQKIKQDRKQSTDSDFTTDVE
ncbi:DNA-directed RNA polymerase subunit beta [Patescibacteria group bacterium]|nr:DNA-directed RNA polymerase subunit beta [Patescibacteria group bacterium]MBU1721544.1 DNA-directed RNA polymerase subunit beta [Patescibacteria group bacterium]MBU1901549.1 DNA-directed RNA polymerase subunit beta [Patescibacteria group bacterium]